MKGKTLPRFVFAAAIVLLCAAGLYVRRRHGAAPDFFNTYFPDAAWTMAVYCGFGLLFRRGVRLHLPLALGVSYLVECSQLLDTPLLRTLRGTTLGGLVLGYGFLWSDLVCYTAGALLCAAAEYLACRMRNKPEKT